MIVLLQLFILGALQIIMKKNLKLILTISFFLSTGYNKFPMRSQMWAECQETESLAIATTMKFWATFSCKIFVPLDLRMPDS